MVRPVGHPFVCAFLLGLGLPAYAQTNAGISSPTNAITRYSVRIWQSDDGLPQNSVFAITRTRDGYLWVGTHEGLARFDGLRFVTVDDPAAPELRRGWITALCATSDGSLWIGVEGSGVCRLQSGKVTRFSEAEGLASNQPRCLLEGRDGSIWIGTENGLSRYKDSKFRNYTVKNGLGNNQVRALYEDPKGTLRIATSRGLSSLSPEGRMSTINFGLGTVANTIKSVCQDRENNIWVTSNEGVTRVKGQERVPYSVSEGLPDKIATVVYEDRQGQVWIGTYNGVACLVGGKVISTPMNLEGFGDLVYTIYEDAEDNLWVGGRDGLYRLRPARFTTYTTREGLACNNAMAVLEDRQGTIWIATWGGGINALQDDRMLTYGTTNGLTYDLVLSLHEGRDGNLWLGMDFDAGLNRLDERRRNVLARPADLIAASIRAIHEDRQGAVWIGTAKGLSILRGNQCESYTRAQGLAGNLVMVIHEDQQGQIWIGTDGGLSRWDGQRFKNYTTEDGLSHNAVNAIYEDAQQTLWLGTKGGGLNRFQKDHWSAYGTAQGLFSDEIYEILEDDFGCLWMSCRNGIFRVRKQALDELDRGKLRQVTCTVFGKADGLASVQCNGVAKPAGWKDRQGRLWFPTIRGVAAVESRIKTNENPPPIVIEEVFADRQPIAQSKLSTNATPTGRAVATQSLLPTPGSALKIPAGRGELEFRYTALSLQAPEKNRFKYKLENSDLDWIDAGMRRAAYYNNVPPGNYTFRVIGCNNDGVWNESGSTLALVVLPHYWQTWWFKLASIAAVLLILTAWYRARMARLREIERLRVQIAADLHDDVGARLTKVAMVTEWMDREPGQPERTKMHVQNIAATTREIIRAMDEIVWTINPKNDTLDNLANYIFQYAQEYFQNTSVRCRLDLSARLPDYPISTEERHNLFMVVKEALHNVLKHSDASEVRISLSVEGTKLIILITDNGRGFLPQKLPLSRNGLANMRQRSERIGARLVLESQPGNGTSVKVEADAL
jgi:ligand-binding sensor domain-containing protein/signal transduction histidine kinase